MGARTFIVSDPDENLILFAGPAARTDKYFRIEMRNYGRKRLLPIVGLSLRLVSILDGLWAKTELSLEKPTESRPVCLGGRPVCVHGLADRL